MWITQDLVAPIIIGVFVIFMILCLVLVKRVANQKYNIKEQIDKQKETGSI